MFIGYFGECYVSGTKNRKIYEFNSFRFDSCMFVLNEFNNKFETEKLFPSYVPDVVYSEEPFSTGTVNYGPRYEGNLSFTVAGVNIGGTGVFGRHSDGVGFTIGYGVTLGVDAVPFNIGFNLNRGASSQYFNKLPIELKNAVKTWW
jgi:hypothetical protein